ncbi:epoxide hydrolase family protein [Novosphingobium colocasiae]|uniref:epoxide hydrolase family protein n=1 Tax=Novosphingobium colocasiae TaxID=1256513 RepID=UPI0035B2AF3B
MTTDAIRPFTIAIPDEDLRDLDERLARTRWPARETVADWSQGVPQEWMRALVDHWRHRYDWRRCEAALNALPQFMTAFDGLDIHFLHVRSSNPDAMPLLLTHGWPGSILEFMKSIGPLTQPQAHGGNAADAFHLVIPALPGFGFSGKPDATGWGVGRIAGVWGKLMKRLGYDRWVAQGGDWGSAVTYALGLQQPEGLIAVHTNMPIVMPPPPFGDLEPDQAKMMEAMDYYQRQEAGYSLQQATRPQTVGYALADSPVGQAAWIVEKFAAWSDCDGDPLNILSADELLDAVMMYWLPNCGASSARLYWESFTGGFVNKKQVQIPCGYSVFPKEIYPAPLSWARQCTPRMIHWNTLDKGGHFAALEQPELFVGEVQQCFRQMR